MKIYTPTEAARQAGNKYLGVLVAATGLTVAALIAISSAVASWG